MLLYGILARKTRESFHIKRRKYRITEKDAAEKRAEEIRPSFYRLLFLISKSSSIFSFQLAESGLLMRTEQTALLTS